METLMPKKQSQDLDTKVARLAAWVGEHIKDGKESGAPNEEELLISIEGTPHVRLRVVGSDVYVLTGNKAGIIDGVSCCLTGGNSYLLKSTMLAPLIRIRLDEIAKFKELEAIDKVMADIGIAPCPDIK
jgi:hypothetical protein